MSLSVVFTGATDLKRRIVDITQGLSDATAQRAYLGAAQVLAAKAKSNAPRRTGRLRKAIIARGFASATALAYGPGAYVQVNLRRQATAAPYGLIVENGRIGGAKRRPTSRANGLFVGRRYFARAVETLGDAELEKATANLHATMKRRYLLY